MHPGTRFPASVNVTFPATFTTAVAVMEIPFAIGSGKDSETEIGIAELFVIVRFQIDAISFPA